MAWLIDWSGRFISRNICFMPSENLLYLEIALHPEIAFQSEDCATIVNNLEIVQVTHAHYRRELCS